MSEADCSLCAGEGFISIPDADGESAHDEACPGLAHTEADNRAWADFHGL